MDSLEAARYRDAALWNCDRVKWPRDYDRNNDTQLQTGARRQAALCVHDQRAVGQLSRVRGETVQRFSRVPQRSMRPPLPPPKKKKTYLRVFNPPRTPCPQLRKSISTPPFPSKRIRCSQPKVLEQRRAGLERYLQTVFKIEDGYRQVMEFLGLKYQPR